MNKIQRFEELYVWQLAREICNDIWKVTEDKCYWNDPGLRKQMLDSSGSMMDNPAEGFERGSNPEFKTFLGYGRGSSGELRSQLYRSLDRNFITKDEFHIISGKCIKFSKTTKGLINSLKNSPHKGFRI